MYDFEWNDSYTVVGFQKTSILDGKIYFSVQFQPIDDSAHCSTFAVFDLGKLPIGTNMASSVKWNILQ